MSPASGGKAFEGVGSAHIARTPSGTLASASWASRSACSGSPCAIATRARVLSAGISKAQPVAVATASSAQLAGRDQIPARQCGLRTEGAQVRREPRQNTPVLPGRRGRVQCRPSIAGGQGRVCQRKVTNARGEPAELGSRLQAGLGRGAGGTCLTLPRERRALMREANRLEEPIVGRLGLGGHRAELCDGTSQIALDCLCQTQAYAAVPRVSTRHR